MRILYGMEKTSTFGSIPRNCRSVSGGWRVLKMNVGYPRPRVIAAAAEADPLWYKDAIIYQIHIKSFFDSNNDGIGDFPGLVSKLDYIADLGATAIWLLPFFR